MYYPLNPHDQLCLHVMIGALKLPKKKPIFPLPKQGGAGPRNEKKKNKNEPDAYKKKKHRNAVEPSHIFPRNRLPII